MKRILKRMGRWLGLIERSWWDDLDCSPVVVIGGQMLAAALDKMPAGVQPICKWTTTNITDVPRRSAPSGVRKDGGE